MHTIITGHMTLAVHLSRNLGEHGHEVTIIHENHDVCRTMARGGRERVICGDAVDPRVLDDCGAGSADVVIALTDEDDRNLAICQLARLRFQVPRTLAFVNDPANEEVFHALGVGAVFSPVRILASLVDQRARLGEMVSFLPVAGGKVLLAELTLLPTSPAVGRSLQALALPKGALVAYVMRAGSLVVPNGATVLEEGDHVLLVTTPDLMNAAMEDLVGASEVASGA